MRTLVAVDAQNLYYSARKAGGKVDFQKLWTRIRALGPDTLAIVYLIRGDFDSNSFEGLLRGIGYRLSARKTKQIRVGDRVRTKYGSHEIRIALDAVVKFVDSYDQFILVSGDVDYSDLFKHLDTIEKKTEFWSFNRELCPEMLRTVHKVDFLGKDLLQDQQENG